MDWRASVDIYCERMDPSFWAEPINAISNAAFLIAALIAANTARTHRVTNKAIWLLIILAACIGVGSFLFHTVAEVWSGFADTIPIWLFVLAYAVTSAILIGQVGWLTIALGFVGLAGFVALLTYLTAGLDLNGSEQYAPAVAAMLLFSAISLAKRHAIAPWFVSATVIFGISLAFRTFDMSVCANWPYGTHFMWHILNATMIGLLLLALIRHTQRTTTP
ncbi:ceramidase domain-containing protein [uncultured Litoreibacter sp.]|uniref:ceramidase domain-containing protein n=1 Tax=uncultured Litoreibacter sp. TaxID=1392394 RepID=UPI002639C6C3|nr:ceramidase domain-containing protein [uncultured Litoreibacter sp.]